MHLFPVGEAIAIGVRVVLVGAEAILLGVDQAVAIGVPGIPVAAGNQRAKQARHQQGDK